MTRSRIFHGLLLLLLVCAGTIQAQELTIQQRLLMPGPLTSAHAEFEPECGSCHVTFAQEESSSLCLGCHEEIANDRETSSGFHGQVMLAATAKCDTCHTEHEGRSADILNFIPADFDHIATRFELTGVHNGVDCSGCHQQDRKFREAPTNCAGCHQDLDIHKDALGQECDSCHQTTSWRERLPFDHGTTGFLLEGAHQDADCVGCHLDQQFAIEDTSCISCHAVTDVHAGNNGNECEGCHVTQSWGNITFDHDNTTFPLMGSHRDAACASCHADAGLHSDAPSDCNGCHLADDTHFGRNGDDCSSCHVSEVWQQVSFDHARDTAFVLTGMHEQADCTHCHIGSLDQPLAQDCASCHQADDVHFDVQMSECDSCHVTADWHSVSRFDHDFSQFPLLGLHQTVACENCHLDQQYLATDADCASCHQAEDRHEGALGQDCAGCHSPNGWDIWQFDHQEFTGYSLAGSHEALSCDSCHLPQTNAADTTSDCSSCHISEDIHRGEFGTQCGQCHGSVGFSEILPIGRSQ